MSNSKKRQAEDELPAKKPKKSKKKGSKHQVVDETLDTELGVNTLFSRMDNQLLADYLAQKMTRFGSDLSTVELSDLTISAGHIKNTSSWQEDRTADKLPSFLEKFADKPEDLAKPPKEKGAPHTLIVTGAGLRAADLTRAVRKFQTKESTIAKLFAKHMKVEEQVKFLKSKKAGIAVGTPSRLIELIDNGALKLDLLKHIVVDASHIDQKKRGVLDMKDTMMPLAKFLVRQEFRDRYADEEKPLALLFY